MQLLFGMDCDATNSKDFQTEKLRATKKAKCYFFKSTIIYLIIIPFSLIIIGCKEKKELKVRTEKVVDIDNEFVPIFDGSSLENWKGDPEYWSVENGNLVGIVTPNNLLKRNSFIIWQGSQPENFELKLEYRISKFGNSGINYRSEEIDSLPFALKGYQADIDGRQNYTGQNYEERKRTTLAYRGEKVLIDTSKSQNISNDLSKNILKNCWQTREVIASLGESDLLVSHIKNEDWNDVHLVIKDNVLKHYVNGVLMSEVIDNDTINRSLKGSIGVQVHVGPPMKVEYRNIRIKTF